MVAAERALDVFAAIVGADHVREARPADAVGEVVPRVVVSPADEPEVAAVLAAATRERLTVVPRGGGTKLGWGMPPRRCDVVLSTARIAGIVDHEPADLVCVVRAGTPLAALQRTLASTAGFRQRLMLDPAHGDAATVGGVVATAASGPLRTRFGTPRDLVIGAAFVLADGTAGRSGGKVVKNVAGFDVAKLLVGSLGTLAVITEVAVRLHPLPEASRTVLLESRSIEDLCSCARGLARLQVTPSVVDLHLPDGLVLVRFDSSERGATLQAERVIREIGGRMVRDGEAASLASRYERSPWSEDGAVAALAVLPARVAELVTSIAGMCDAVVMRPLLGTGEARFTPDAATAVRAAAERCGGRVTVRRGRADGEPEGGIDAVALDLMRSVKAQLDPAGTLSPGRMAGGI